MRFSLNLICAALSALIVTTAPFVAPFAAPFAIAADPTLPDSATNDPDFSIQGEYAAEGSGGKGMQVIAIGEGDFEVAIYEGGLPGDGATNAKPRRLDADEDVVLELAESMGLERVNRVSPTMGAKPPVGAAVLFDSTQNSVDQHWKNGKLTEDGLLAQGTTSKDVFNDYTMHLEFRTPWMPNKSGQGRGNSGVYHQGRYETQVLDSFGLEGKNNETGGIYEIRDPDLNMCFPPLSWQTYDVDFTAARYDAGGKKTANAKISVRLNGVLVQDEVDLPRSTRAAPVKEGPQAGPIHLQEHGAAVRYRNIWILPRDAAREARRPIVPGFERFYAASSTASAEAGELLISSLACDACHAGLNVDVLPAKRGPDLTKIAGRVRTDALVKMITDPHAAKNGTAMPMVWHGLDADERQRRAEAITSYLKRRGKGELRDQAVDGEAIKRGERLYHEIGCVACHTSFNGPETSSATSVPLGDVARKYTVNSLADFISKPHDVRPGLRMPAVTGSRADATAIAAYLTRSVVKRLKPGKFRRRLYTGKWSKLPDFDSLEVLQTDEVTSLSLRGIKPKNDYGLVFDAKILIPESGDYEFSIASDDGSRLIIGDQRVEVDGIHPKESRTETFTLTKGTHSVRIEFFNGGGGAELEATVASAGLLKRDLAKMIYDPDNVIPDDFLPSKFVPDESLVAAGETYFRTSGCANCHAFVGDPASELVAPALDSLNVGQGCLATDVSENAVDYQLSLAQRAAITEAIQQRRTQPIEWTDEKRIHMTMVGLNCYACHQRDKIGGPEKSRDPHFQTSIPEMGWEGRLPPALDGVGDKLNDVYMATILKHGANARPYMKTRMPGYDYEPLRAFHESIDRIDRKMEYEPVHNPAPEETVLPAGRRAVGNSGLACIKCHRFGGNKGGGIGAIDMLTMTERLRVEWFHRYLMNPTKYRPGTRMPNSFPDGVSALKDLYEGDPPMQIDAMWRYLSQGKKAKEPAGLVEGAIVLGPTDQPLIYRNFFTDVTPRGIGVAYPGAVNLIWDAERMSLIRAWKDEFIDAAKHWRNRGQGSQQPMGAAIIDLETATPLASLSAIDSTWPDANGRDAGYRFKGYRLDSDGNPAFNYTVGQASITDHPKAVVSTTQKSISRRIGFENVGEDANLVWQFAIGSIQASGDSFTVNGTVRMKITGVQCQIVDVDGKQALRATIPGGSAVITQTIAW